MRRIAQDLGLEDTLSEKDVATLAASIIAKADRDSDGQLNLDEFLYFHSMCLASSKRRGREGGEATRKLVSEEVGVQLKMRCDFEGGEEDDDDHDNNATTMTMTMTIWIARKKVKSTVKREFFLKLIQISLILKAPS